MNTKNTILGRGAQQHTHNRFIETRHEIRPDFLEFCKKEGELADTNKTSFTEIFPKTIINRVKSSDIDMNYSLNPYQGCEHGCVYCYARNSHEYWGYGAGLDFERKILVKRNAPHLLEKKLCHKNWKAQPIILSGNTDCYQPIEKELQITKRLLELFLQYRHPVRIITKNALIQRDLGLLKELAQDNLIAVHLSITSLQEATRRLLEPRTASIKKRLQVLELLSANNIPVHVMMAPIIPAINCHEILPLVKDVANKGAKTVDYTIVRLNGATASIFTDWITKTMPDRATKVLHQIASCHGGSLSDSRSGVRLKGEGPIATHIHQQFTIARKKYFPNNTKPHELNCELHEAFKNRQLRLF